MKKTRLLNIRSLARWMVAVGLLVAGLQPGMAQIYIDPLKGSDTNPGTLGAPFRSLARAQTAVRTMNKSMRRDVVVYLRGGRYPVQSTLTFTELDNGTNGHRVIYQAYVNETPILDAGVRVTNWQRVNERLWKATGIPVDNFRQLYVNGVRANRARSAVRYTGSGWPNPPVAFVEENWKLEKQYYPEGIKVGASAIRPGWGNARDIELVWIGEESHCTWRSHRLLVDGLEADGADSTVIRLANYGYVLTGASMSRPLPESPFYLENALELLDSPGEWYLDRRTDELYYQPRPGEDLTTAEVFIPGNVETVFRFEGTSLARKVASITLRGLTFQHTTWLRPSTSRLGACSGQADRYISGHGQIGRAHKAIHRREFFYDPAFDFVVDAQGEAEGFKPDACLELNATDNIRIENCHFRHLGAVGIDLTQGCNRTVIDGNRFEDASATALVVGRWDQDYIGPGEEVCKNLRVTNNRIRRVGQEYYNSPGITAFFTDGMVLAHNELSDLPYSGISSGWGSWGGKTAWTTSNRRNVIEFNRIENFCQRCSDGGGIYTIGIGKARTDPDTLTSKIRYNYIRDCGMAYGALYPDEGSCYYELVGNVTENVETSPKGKWLHLWSVNHHNIRVDGNFSNSPKHLNKGINCPLTRHTVYEGENRPAPAAAIIAQAGPEPAYRRRWVVTPPAQVPTVQPQLQPVTP